ncbi:MULTISPECIES: hypothetical protein [Virgibacillus]|uniref:Uncharacterized protein n=2 Tax=Virgibacillus TaxID=84406 RepID=A0A024Q8E6_9BACI|nr:MULTISPECIES: hypothetical protein [Virgibacillus]EQB38285.1 hypothetical protein M948_06815 [Virgibacillus sp. CM-4]GGJ53389.1 hypothetical protein GCM10007111_14500 [Virgibacillus kapii]CDQ38211.1 hypothetical protein BN990_00478 [Virgibacillus massiliensis]
MKKVLVAIFAMLIITFGIFGYVEMNDDSNEIVDENPNSIKVNS